MSKRCRLSLWCNLLANIEIYKSRPKHSDARSRRFRDMHVNNFVNFKKWATVTEYNFHKVVRRQISKYTKVATRIFALALAVSEIIIF